MYVCMYVYILYYVCAFLFRDDPSTQRKKIVETKMCPTLGHIPKIIQITFELVNWIMGSCFFCWGNLRKPWHFGNFSRVQGLEAPYEMLRNTTSAAVQKEPSAMGERHVAPETPVNWSLFCPKKLHFYKAQLSYLSSWVTKCRCFTILHHCHGNHWLFSCMDANGCQWVKRLNYDFYSFFSTSKFTKWTSPIFNKSLQHPLISIDFFGKKNLGEKKQNFHDISQSLHDVPFFFSTLKPADWITASETAPWARS